MFTRVRIFTISERNVSRSLRDVKSFSKTHDCQSTSFVLESETEWIVVKIFVSQSSYQFKLSELCHVVMLFLPFDICIYSKLHLIAFNCT